MCRQPDFTQWAFLCEDGVGIEHVFFKKIYLRGTLCDSNEMESRWIESTWMVDVVVELILFESKTGKGNVGVGVCCCLSREMRGENVTKVSGDY